MTPEEWLLEIEITKVKLCHELNMYCMEQQRLWQEIPWLLVGAYGKIGYDDVNRHAHAYESGYWQIWVDDHRGEMCVACIDLATGKLVQVENKEPVTDMSTMLTILDNLRLVDARRIVRWVEEQYWRAPDPKWKPGQLEMIHERLRERYQVKPVYERPTGPRPISG